MLRRAFIAVSLLLCGRAFAQAPDSLQVDTANSTLTYHLIHKMHRVDGISKKVEGKARLLPNGQAQVMVRAPVQSFDSGNVNRDEHMKEAVDAARYPNVEIKAVTDGITVPSTFPATLTKPFKVQLNFHGVQQTFEVPVELQFERADRARANAKFSISLDGYKVERPSLMFIKVDDELKIDVKLQLVK